MTEACNDENAAAQAVQRRLFRGEAGLLIVQQGDRKGRDFCARVMTWAKSLENVLLPVKIGLVELLIRIPQSPDRALMKRRADP